MFGDSEVKDAVFKKLDKWLQNPPDYHDVAEAYSQRGKLQSEKVAIVRTIESVEDEILSDENNKPRSNETRIKKLAATKNQRDYLAHIEQQIAENDALCKWLEFKKSMFSSAMYRVKMQMDL
jgi:hypothetical protein